MYLCLSSGSRPRYKRDIIRALALPYGAQIQFRYRRQWIAPAILTSLEDPKHRKKLRGADALIAYIDQTSQTPEPQIVPCRMAKLFYATLRIAAHHPTLYIESSMGTGLVGRVYGGVIRRYEGKGALDIGREIREARKSLQRTDKRDREKA